MAINQPYVRTCRQFTDGRYADEYFRAAGFAKDGEHYVRALRLIQKDLLELFEFIEPDKKNENTYSYRTHALLMRAAIEVEANCRAILDENDYKKVAGDPKRWNIVNFYKLEGTHLLSQYEIMLPVWKGPAAVRKPFDKWATSGDAPEWWQAYNHAKHNRSGHFDKATFINLIDAVCALVAILSAQFYTHDFSRGPGLISWGSVGVPPGFEMAIGEYFMVKFPTWPAAYRYDFKWDAAKTTFQKHF